MSYTGAPEMIDCEDADRDERPRFPTIPDLGDGVLVHFRAPKPRSLECVHVDYEKGHLYYEAPLYSGEYVARITDGHRRKTYAAGHPTMPGVALAAAVALWRADCKIIDGERPEYQPKRAPYVPPSN